jgi:hypothetical protein
MIAPAIPERARHRCFLAEIISHGVWLSKHFCRSARDIEALRYARRVT